MKHCDTTPKGGYTTHDKYMYLHSFLAQFKLIAYRWVLGEVQGNR